jgi:excisionase family DNA binding protein
VTITITLKIGGQPLIAELDDAALALIAAAITPASEPEPESPYLSIPEAAAWLRKSRQAVDDMLSAGKLTRHKVGTRTLIARAELEALIATDPRRTR